MIAFPQVFSLIHYGCTSASTICSTHWYKQVVGYIDHIYGEQNCSIWTKQKILRQGIMHSKFSQDINGDSNLVVPNLSWLFNKSKEIKKNVFIESHLTHSTYILVKAMDIDQTILSWLLKYHERETLCALSIWCVSFKCRILLNRLITQYIYQWICNSNSSQLMQVRLCIDAILLLTWMFQAQLDIGWGWY